MPRRSAEARTSAAWAASSSGTPKWRNVRLLKSRNASMGKSLVSTSGMFSPLSVTLRRQGLPAGFKTKRNEEQPNGERDGGQRDGDSQRLKMLNAGTDQKGDSRSANHSVETAKFAPPKPRKKRQTKNHGSAAAAK